MDFKKKFTEYDFVRDDLRAQYQDEDIVTYDFPIDVFPGDIQFFFMELSRTMNFSVDYLGSAFLSLIGSLNGNAFKLKVKETWNAPSVFWVAIVGDTGAMKTHPVKLIFAPFVRIEKENYKQYEKDLVKYEVEVEENENNKFEKRKLQKPVYLQHRMTDTTLEALYQVHTVNKNGIYLYKDELKGWVNSMNQYKKSAGGDVEFWLESFNNADVTINRVTRDVMKIDDVNINVIGTIQPSKLREIKIGDNGFLERMLFCKPETTVHAINKNNLDPKYVDWYDELIRNFYDYIQHVKEGEITIEMDDDVFDEFIRIDKKIVDQMNHEETDNHTKGYLSKMRTYLPRFVLCLWLVDYVMNEKVLNVDHVKKAERLVDYFVTNARAMFQENKKSDDISTITDKNLTTKEKVQELISKEFRITDIAKHLGISKGRVSQIKKNLEEKSNKK